MFIDSAGTKDYSLKLYIQVKNRAKSNKTTSAPVSVLKTKICVCSIPECNQIIYLLGFVVLLQISICINTTINFEELFARLLSAF